MVARFVGYRQTVDYRVAKAIIRTHEAQELVLDFCSGEGRESTPKPQKQVRSDFRGLNGRLNDSRRAIMTVRSLTAMEPLYRPCCERSIDAGSTLTNRDLGTAPAGVAMI